MNKLIKTASLIAMIGFSALADSSNFSASIGASYETSHLVNNASQAQSAATASLNVGTTYLGIDFSANGSFLANSSDSEGSRWGVGLGKAFPVREGFSVRLDGNVDRAQTGQKTIKDYTEADVKLAVNNKFVVPYVKGAYQVELDQYGYTVGLEKSFSVLKFLTLTPALEYTKMTDYETYAVKVTASKTVWKNLSVFAEGAYIDNNFLTKDVNFAVKELNGSLVGSGGVKWTF